MPNDKRPPHEFLNHMEQKHGMSTPLAAWIFYHKMGASPQKAKSSIKEGLRPEMLEEYRQEYNDHPDRDMMEATYGSTHLINSTQGIKESMVKSRKRILSETTTLKEAMSLPGHTLWSPGTLSLIKTAYKVEDKYRVQLLQEAEDAAEHDEEVAKKLHEAEMGNAGDGPDDKEEERAGISETLAHGTEGSEGSSGTEIPPLGAEDHVVTTMENAPGKNQMRESKLKEDTGPGVIDYPMAEGPSQDPLNACIIQKMDEGMSQVEAHNACNREVQMVNGMVREALKPIITKYTTALKARDKFYQETIKGLKETIKLQDEKLKETVGGSKNGTITMRVPAGPGGMKSMRETVAGPTEEIDVLSKISSNPVDLESHRRDVLSRFAQ